MWKCNMGMESSLSRNRRPQIKRPTMAERHTQLEMWTNAQRDGRSAEHRWRPLFNAAKFGWHPLLECRAVTLPRREIRWNLQGCPKLPNRSQPLVGEVHHITRACEGAITANKFFPIVDICLTCEKTARQMCAMVPRWRFFGSCVSSEPRAANFRHAFQNRARAIHHV